MEKIPFSMKVIVKLQVLDIISICEDIQKKLNYRKSKD